MNIRPNETNDKAVAAFLTAKVQIDTMLARLTELSEDHFETHPDTINWSDVADLGRIAEVLKRATDVAFSEGENAK